MGADFSFEELSSFAKTIQMKSSVPIRARKLNPRWTGMNSSFPSRAPAHHLNFTSIHSASEGLLFSPQEKAGAGDALILSDLL